MQIVTRILAGDVNAYELLVERHKEHIFCVVAKRVPRSDVESVAQRTFVDGYRSLRTLSPEGAFEHWLVKIAIRRCCDYWRKREREVTVSNTGLSRGQMDVLDEVCAAASREEFEERSRRENVREIVDWALGELSAEDRTLVDLVYLQGWTMSEAGDAMGWGISKTKVRAMRARAKLKKVLMRVTEATDHE